MIIYLNASTPKDYYWAAGILALSCITDLIDGKVARHYNMISTLGKVLDPLADKATQFALILCIGIRKPTLLYLVGIFVVKECFQLIAGYINWKRGRMLKGALFSGKICTTILFISLIMLIMLPDLSEDLVTLITIADICFLAYAFIDYIIVYCRKDDAFQPLPQKKEE